LSAARGQNVVNAARKRRESRSPVQPPPPPSLPEIRRVHARAHVISTVLATSGIRQGRTPSACRSARSAPLQKVPEAGLLSAQTVTRPPRRRNRPPASQRRLTATVATAGDGSSGHRPPGARPWFLTLYAFAATTCRTRAAADKQRSRDVRSEGQSSPEPENRCSHHTAYYANRTVEPYCSMLLRAVLVRVRTAASNIRRGYRPPDRACQHLVQQYATKTTPEPSRTSSVVHGINSI